MTCYGTPLRLGGQRGAASHCPPRGGDVGERDQVGGHSGPEADLTAECGGVLHQLPGSIKLTGGQPCKTQMP